MCLYNLHKLAVLECGSRKKSPQKVTAKPAKGLSLEQNSQTFLQEVDVCITKFC